MPTPVLGVPNDGNLAARDSLTPLDSKFCLRSLDRLTKNSSVAQRSEEEATAWGKTELQECGRPRANARRLWTRRIFETLFSSLQKRKMKKGGGFTRKKVASPSKISSCKRNHPIPNHSRHIAHRRSRYQIGIAREIVQVVLHKQAEGGKRTQGGPCLCTAKRHNEAIGIESNRNTLRQTEPMSKSRAAIKGSSSGGHAS